MNLPLDHSGFVADRLADYKAARSDLLDAFFELELQVGRWLRLLGRQDMKCPLGNRLQALAETPTLQEFASKKQAKYVRNLPNTSSECLRIRNAVVHSRAKVGLLDGEERIFLETLPLVIFEEGALIPISMAEIEQATKNVRNIANNLRHYLTQLRTEHQPNPPSSPPLPSPGAAAGP